MKVLQAVFGGWGDRVRRFGSWTGFGEKKLIDYIQLIVLPFVLIVGGQLVSQAVNASARAQALEDAQERRLQEYLDQVATLALDRELLLTNVDQARGAVIREVARARTLTALAAMDGPRKRFVITFLYELSLINGHDELISLANADLEEADLSGAELFGANLNHASLPFANLERARLTSALMNGARLSNANMTHSLLVDARLNQADLRLAVLRESDASNASLFSADLRGADVSDVNFTGANLRSTDLRGALMRGAILQGADLTGALIGDQSNEESFTDLQGVDWHGAICPDGTASPDEGCAGHL
ncbi:MAG: pentapeptide repeat-containing protein, partial [Dehalococcoidia bacterium]